jgi:steroid delta-isomerase-like uncharacterized protein
MNPTLGALIGRHLAAENAQVLPGTLATLHPDCRFEDLATGQTWRGHDGAAAHYRQWWTTFDVTVKRGPGQSSAWTDGHGYIAEATWHGKHVGPFLGIAPSGRTIVQPFVVVLSFKDGLMLSERFQYDLASLLRQIGAEPIPALASCSSGRLQQARSAY